MNTILHYPEFSDAKKELSRQTAFLHAQAILKALDSIPLSTSQKLRLIDELKKGSVCEISVSI